jgi:hypothetical protein
MISIRPALPSVLLFCGALAASCDRSPAPVPDAAPQASLRADDPSCRLPLENFARSYLRFRGNIIDYPMNRVIVDRAGRILWNARPVEPRVLESYIRAQAVPPVLVVISPERGAPCAAVQDVLAAAMRAGCRRDRCVFEWPGTDAPPGRPAAAPPPRNR